LIDRPTVLFYNNFGVDPELSAPTISRVESEFETNLLGIFVVEEWKLDRLLESIKPRVCVDEPTATAIL